MSKFLQFLFAVPLAFAFPATLSNAAILGPAANACTTGDGPAMLVKVSGFKNRNGTVRVRTFLGSKPSSWFDKKQYLSRIVVAVPDSGPVEVCAPVPRVGGYVVDIRHDINNNGDTDKADGAGASGNPKLSLLDVLLGRKPPASKVVVNVGNGVQAVPIAVQYVG